MKEIRDGQFTKTGKTMMQRAALTVAQSLGCPLIIPGIISVMTRKSFMRTCLAMQARRQKKGAFEGSMSESNTCSGCKMGARIREGERFNPPKWVKFRHKSTLEKQREIDNARLKGQEHHKKVKNMCGACGVIWYANEGKSLCLNCERDFMDNGPSWGVGR